MDKTNEKETLWHVRLSRPGDKMQEMTVDQVDPKTMKPLENPRFVEVKETEYYRPDFERRMNSKKINCRDLGIMFVKHNTVFMPDGQRKRVALRQGNISKDGEAVNFDPKDIIHNAVEEYDVPQSVLHKFKLEVNKGWLVIEGRVEEGKVVKDEVPLPEGQGIGRPPKPSKKKE